MFIYNLIGFNVVWFGLVYWGNNFIPVAVAFLFSHIYLNRSYASSELILIFSVATVGVGVDSILQFLGVFIFSEQSHLPFWLMTLWLCFGTTLSHSLAFLGNSKLYQILVGIFVAPLSYLAGQHFDAVDLGLGLLETYVVLSIIWGLLMVSFFYLKSLLIKAEVDYV
jgi:hypothetical protein